MALVYNSFKNDSCKNLKRQRDDEEICQSRYKKIRENLEKRGLVEVNQDILSEQFNKICNIEKKEMEVEEEKVEDSEEEEIEEEEIEEEESEEEESEEEVDSDYDYETANEYYSENELEEIDEEKYNIIKEIESLIQ
jgi:hypothetical protein